ncbi:SRPBCC family protein [Thermoleophilia bacterium SCSIO 60948]|nr:SRPBCC family protein [Thermoleophilia bacterium SCSIO 60948]
MKLEHSFDVEAPIDRVWQTLIDVERVAPCLPGAEITDHDDEGNYSGNFQVRLGPTTASYAGKLRMEELDEESHRVVMNANGRDKRGQGSAKATIVSTMSESGGITHVDVVTDFSLTGKLARFGRGGMIQDISDRLVGDFVDCLKATVTAEPDPAPAADPASPEAPTGAPSAGASGTAEGAVEGAPASATSVAPSDGLPSQGPASASLAAPGAPSPPRPAPRPAAPPPAKPVKGLSLLLSVLWGRVKRLLAHRRT